LGNLNIRPLAPSFGMELLGIDLNELDAPTVTALQENFETHGVVLCRGQSLNAPAQLALTRVFGEPAPNTRLEFCLPDYPAVYLISNKVVDGRVVGEMNAGYGWHTDMSYTPTPALCTILHGVEVPPEGSDTLLADMLAAFEALPTERQQQIDGLRVHHSFVSFMRKRGVALTQEQVETHPDVFHPVVRRHRSGRKSIWAASISSGIQGMPNPEGLQLLNELLSFATQDQFVYRHKWLPGDVLIWDDRRTMHTGTAFDHQRYVRHMQRTWVPGEVPV
jgi:taurine dioxygenase